MQIGIDLGSRTVKLAVLKDGQLINHQIIESGFDPARQSQDMIRSYSKASVTATGYGRHLARKLFAREVITEIKAHALGARHLFPECRTIIDIGGQDSKVIALNGKGQVTNFQMNDKCAAGTGRFLEIMAASLGYRLDEFGPAALAATGEIQINSMCTVFAESEVISLKNRGTPPEEIAKGVHISVVSRITGMLNRVGYGKLIVFSGGVARNSFMVAMLRKNIPDATVMVPDAPDVVGALGAALFGYSKKRLDNGIEKNI